jgi:DNA-binding Xre family transcriptional regulator
LVDLEDARTIGARLRQIRRARRKSLVVVAGLAGVSKSHLSRIERGDVALDSLAELLALAEALQISPSELIRLPVPAPANGQTDAAVNAVFLALMAARRHRPGGQVLPVEALRARVMATVEAHCRCDRGGEVGAGLPTVIRDLHTSIAAGRDVAELLELAVLLHSNATVGWLRVVAPDKVELREMAAELALRAAERRDTPEARGLAVWGGLYVMVTAGAADLAWAELDSLSVPTRTPEGMQLAGTLALCRSFLAAVDSRPGEVDAPLDYAAELAARTGEINAYGLGFGPQDVGQWRMRALLETGDHELAVRVAEGLRPQTHLLRSRQADLLGCLRPGARPGARTPGGCGESVPPRRGDLAAVRAPLRDRPRGTRWTARTGASRVPDRARVAGDRLPGGSVCLAGSVGFPGPGRPRALIGEGGRSWANPSSLHRPIGPWPGSCGRWPTRTPTAGGWVVVAGCWRCGGEFYAPAHAAGGGPATGSVGGWAPGVAGVPERSGPGVPGVSVRWCPVSVEQSRRFVIMGQDPQGRNRTIIGWREAEYVAGTVVKRVVLTLDATLNTATVLTTAEALELGQKILAAAQ